MKNLIICCLIVVIWIGSIVSIGKINELNQRGEFVIVVTQIVEVPVEKNNLIVLFGNTNQDDDVYTQPTQEPITEEFIQSGDWSDLPLDQNSDGVITCDDFLGDKLGLDSLLDLAYNRYGAKYLDQNDDGKPCNE